jgi:purine-binding chemotaxis protein CheW
MSAARASFLVAKARSRFAAVRIEDAREVMRPLPVEPLSGTPPFLLGLSVIRGAPVPVVDLGALVGSPEPRETSRYLTVEAGARRVALALEAVLGVRELDATTFDRLPPLRADARADAIASVAALDRRLLLVLEAARLIPEELWRALTEAGAS